MGFYLIGGNTAEYFWYVVTYAFAVGLVCALLTSFRYLRPIALAVVNYPLSYIAPRIKKVHLELERDDKKL